MEKENQSREQLLAELAAARRRIAELELIKERSNNVREELRRSEGQFRSLVDSTDDSIYVVDRQCRYLFMNRKHLGRLGISGDFYVGKHYRDFHSPKEADDFQIHIETVFRTGQSLQHEYQAERDKKYFLRTLSPVREAGEAVAAVTAVSKEITDRKRMEEELRALSFSDDLTGLYNRRGFFTVVQQQLRVASRLARNVVLFGLDMDDLKRINDTCGHLTGDSAIRDAADIIRKNFRESDVIARIGGDEFAVFMIENINIDPSRLILRLQDILKIYNSQGTRPYMLSLSIGMTRQDPRKPSSIEDMLRQADQNMYEQKRVRDKDR